MIDPISLAGTLISGVNLINDLAATFRDLRSWEEQDLEVDFDWLPLAKEKGLIEGDLSEYGWMSERRVPTAELKGTHQVVVAYNKSKKIIYKIVMGKASDAGGRNILVHKSAAS